MSINLTAADVLTEVAGMIKHKARLWRTDASSRGKMQT